MGRLWLLALVLAGADCSSDAAAVTGPTIAVSLSTIPVVTTPTWSATCGTITQAGLWTAPSSPQTCRIVVSDVNTLPDTAVFDVVAPPPTVGGIAFGATQIWDDLNKPYSEGIVLAQIPPTPSTIVMRIDTARKYRKKIVFNLPGGSHDKFMSTINGVYQFDHAKWTAALQLYNTTAIKAAMAQGVTDGVVLGINIIDEPHVTGLGDGNTWGPAGTFTKVRVDSLCAESKAIFPTTPVGPTHQHQLFDVSHGYKVCEFLIDQYQYSFGSQTAWRTAALQMAARDNMVILFGANWLAGGVKDLDGTWDCKDQGGYLGQYSPLCQMTPVQLRATSDTLGPWGCAFRGWRWDTSDLSAYQPTLRDASAYLASQPGRRCSTR